MQYYDEDHNNNARIVDVMDPNLLGRNRASFNLGRAVNRASSFFFYDVEEFDQRSFRGSDLSAESAVQADESYAGKIHNPIASGKVHCLVMSVVTLFLILSTCEMAMVLLFNPAHRSHNFYVILHVLMAGSTFIMALLLIGMFFRAAANRKGALEFFKCFWNTFDLLFVSFSIGLEIVAIITIRSLPSITLSALMLRIYSSFRIANLLNQKIIHREGILMQRRRQMNSELSMELESRIDKGSSLYEELAQTKRLIARANDEISAIADGIIKVKRSSWSSLVPEYVATNVAISRRSSFTEKKSQTTLRTLNSKGSFRISTLAGNTSTLSQDFSFMTAADNTEFDYSLQSVGQQRQDSSNYFTGATSPNLTTTSSTPRVSRQVPYSTTGNILD